MPFPLISVVVPVYNVQDYLRKCLDSIVRQTFQDFEAILIDDGSTDLSGKICDEYADKKQFFVYHQSNKGSSSARNLGMAHSHGKYQCFVDADDWLETTFLENLFLSISQSDSDVAISAFYTNNGNREQYFPNKPSILSGETIIKESLNGTIHSGLVFKIIKRELIQSNHLVFPPDNYFEDMYFNCALMLCAKSISYCQSAAYHYRFNPLSQTNDTNCDNRLNRYCEFSRNMTNLFDRFDMWNNKDFCHALYTEVNSQKLRLLKYFYNTKTHETLKQSFPHSSSHYQIKHIPDFFAFLALKTNRHWPLAILQFLLETKQNLRR